MHRALSIFLVLTQSGLIFTLSEVIEANYQINEKPSIAEELQVKEDTLEFISPLFPDHRRKLDEANPAFKEIDDILRSSSIYIERTEITDLPFPLPSSSKLILEDLNCEFLGLNEITDSFQNPNRFWSTYSLGLNRFDLSCNFNWQFIGGSLGDGQEIGSGILLTDGNTLDIVFRFVRRLFSWNNENNEAYPPQGLNLRRCALDLDFSVLEFEGGTRANILSTLDNIVGLQFQREIRDILCQQVEAFSKKNFTSTLQGFVDRIEPFLEAQNIIIETENIPAGVNVVDFSDTKTWFGKIFTFGVNFFDNVFGKTSKDGKQPGINSFLKDNFLDSANTWSFDLNNFSLEAKDNELDEQSKEESTILTDVEFKTLRVKGLDSFSVFEVFKVKAPQTVQSQFQLDIFEIEIDVEISIKPNPNLDLSVNEDVELDSFQLEFPSQKELVTLVFEFDEIEADGSIFAAIDFERISNLQLGNLLNLTNLPSCLMSTSIQIALVDTFLTIGTYQIPFISGLISDGVDAILSNAIKNVLSLYGDMVDTSVLENFVTEKVTEIFNNKINDLSQSACPRYTPKIGTIPFIDFRDAFLPPLEAQAAGGSGNNPLGDAYILKNYVEEALLQSDVNGIPLLNEQVIGPITRSQSNITGTFSLKDDQFLTKVPLCIAMCADYELHALNASIENLDSVGLPFDILKPMKSDPYLLENNAIIGTTVKPLRASFDLLIISEDWKKKLGISLELSQLSLFASIIAKVNEQSIIQLPLSEISNINCWIATLPTLVLDENGFADTGINYPSAALADIDITVKQEVKFKIECLDCDNSALGRLSESVEKLSGVGMIDGFIRRVLKNAKAITQTLDIQFLIDELIQESSSMCPIHKSFGSNSSLNGYNFVRNTPLSSDLVELSLYAAVLILQMAMYSVSNMIPLVDELKITTSSESNSFDSPSEIEYLDFTDSTSILGSLFQGGMKFVQTQLLSRSEDTLNSEENDIILNTVFRENLLNEDGEYEIPVSSLAFTRKDITLSSESIKIVGLDSINKVEAFDIKGPQSILTDFSLRRLKAQTHLSITASSNTSEPEMTEEKVGTDLVFDAELEDINIRVLLQAGFNKAKLDRLSLESFLFLDHMIPCVLSTFGLIDFSEFNVEFGNFAFKEQSGILSDSDRNELINSFDALFPERKEGIQRSLNTIVDQLARPELNQAIKNVLANATCPNEKNVETDFVDFRDFFLNVTAAQALGATGEMPFGDLASTFAALFNENIASRDPNGLSSVNRLIPNNIEIPGDLFDFSLELNDIASINDVASIRIANLSISNLDTVGHPLQILSPRNGEPYVLDNQILLGYGEDPIQISFQIIQSFSGDTANMKNEVEVEIEIHKLLLDMSIFAKIDTRSLFQFPLRDMANFHCWLATIPSQADSLGIYGVRVSGNEPNMMLENIDYLIEDFSFSAKCTSCSSSDLAEFVDAISTLDSNSTFSQSLNQALNYTKEVLIGGLFQMKLDRMIVEAHKKCPHKDAPSITFEEFSIPSIETDALEVTIGLASAYLFIIVIIVTASIYSWKSARRRHEKWLCSLTADEKDRLNKWYIFKERNEMTLCSQTQALIKSEDIMMFSRYLFPFIVFANIALFISGHLNIGGAVVADLHFAGEFISIPNFFEFSIAETVREMWTSGVKSLAIIIFLLSVLWPYCRQCILLFLWIAPPSRLSIQRRGVILNQLDSLGKWSIVDIYLLMISLVCFRISLKSPSNHKILPENFYGLDVMLMPLWGLYANMIAQLISQLSSHFVIFQHKRVLANAQKRLGGKFNAEQMKRNRMRNIDSENPEIKEKSSNTALKDENFSSYGSAEGKIITLRYSSKVLICLVGLATFILLILGCSLPSFRIDLIGLAAELIKAGEETQTSSQLFSIFDIVKVVMDQALYLNTAPHYVGLTSFCILFLSTTLVTPSILTILLLSIWFVPMGAKMRDRVLHTISILNAWQYLEVYIISVFLAMWQVGDISEIMVEDLCGSLDQLFTTLFFLGVLSEENARCFYTSVDVESGFYLLILTSLMLQWLSTFTLNATSHQNTVYFHSEFETNINDQHIDKNDNEVKYENKKNHFKTCFTESSSWALEFTEEEDPIDEYQQDTWFEHADDEPMYLQTLRHEENHDNIEVAIAMEPIKGPYFDVSIVPSQSK